MTIAIKFGAMALPIRKQLGAAGFAIGADEAHQLQQDADAVTRLCIRGVLSDSAASSARKRIIRRIAAFARRSQTTGLQ